MTNYDERFEELHHFDGTFEELRRMVSMTGIGGTWHDLQGQKHQQFVAENGAILNFWPSTKRINLQGQPEAAKNELRNKVAAVIYKNTNTIDKLFEPQS